MRTRLALAVSVFALLGSCSGGSSSPPLAAPEAALPITLSNDHLSLTFESDPELGVRLTDVTEHTAPSHVFRNDPIAGDDARLWEARLTLSDGDTATISGRDARTFELTHDRGPNGEPALRFDWSGVRAPLGVAFEVSVLVWIDVEEPLSRWTATVDRSPGSVPAASLDALDLPIVQIEPPATPRAGESVFDAQFRTRLLVPSIQIDESHLAPNLPFALWVCPPGLGTAPVDVSWTHPGPRQNMQFAALAGVDPKDPGYRRVLFVGTEDTTGHTKAFRHRAVVETSPDAVRYEWRATHFPPFADRTNGRVTEWANTYQTPYPSVLGALHAQTDAYWIDATAQYRRFVERVGLAGPRLEDNPRLVHTHEPSLYAVFVQSRPNQNPPTLYARFLERTLAFQRALESSATETLPTFLQWQNYFDQASPVGNPDTPLSTHVDAGVAEAVAWAAARDIQVAPYLRPTELAHCLDWQESFPPSAEAYDRAGRALGSDDTTECAEGVARLDYAHPQAAAWFGDYLGRELVRQFGFHGLYLDVLSGSGSRLTYDPPGLPRGHVPHGGDGFTRGKVSAIDALREVLRTQHGDDQRTFVVGEATEEYLAGHLDAMGSGQGWLPQHLQLAEPALLADLEIKGLITLPDGLHLPRGATDWSPPLWNLVYHEWAPAQQLTIPWTTVGLANGDVYPGEYETPEGRRHFSGLDVDEWVDLLSYTHAQLFNVGSKPATLLYDMGFDAPMIQLDAEGELILDEQRDPERAAWRIVDFFRTLQAMQRRDLAGRFVRVGRAERPLPELPGLPTAVAVNPTSACRKTWDGHGNVTYPFAERPHPSQSIVKKTLGRQEFPVLRVLHSVWRSPEGELGIVLTNWSGTSAEWSGRMHPKWFGERDDWSWRIAEIEADGSRRVHGEGRGPISLRADDGESRGTDEIVIGSVPARSVRVFVLEPAR